MGLDLAFGLVMPGRVPGQPLKNASANPRASKKMGRHRPKGRLCFVPRRGTGVLQVRLHSSFVVYQECWPWSGAINASHFWAPCTISSV